MVFPEFPEPVVARHKKNVVAKNPRLLKMDSGGAEKIEFSFHYPGDIMERVAGRFEVIGDVEKVVVGLYAFQAQDGESQQGQAGKIEQRGADAKAAGRDVADVLKRIIQDGDSQGAGEDGPEDRYEKLVEQGKVRGDPMHELMVDTNFLMLL